jgi:predicted CoA-substrate-specific enzyme activase
MKRLGIDIGSLYMAAVILDDGRIAASSYAAHGGKIESSLRSLLERPDFSGWDRAGVTATMTDPGTRLIDGTLAAIEGARHLLPSTRNVIALSGQSFTLILYDEKGNYREHTTNPPCASGTGSFLEQQAERLGLTVAELSARALGFSGRVPRIATRCAVFAKTDITHAMQEGHSLDGVCAGLCEGIARSVLDMLLKGRELAEPVGLVGGVSLNATIATSIQSLIGKRVEVPEGSELSGAVGAALLGTDAAVDVQAILQKKGRRRSARAPLSRELGDYPSFDAYRIEESDGVESFQPRSPVSSDGGAFLGIDIGSTSTKAVLLREDRGIVGGFYTRTLGDPIAAVQRLLGGMTRSLGGKAPVLHGVTTTGSGRKMVREVFSADGEINEITAHANAAVFLLPQTDTIIEIGGQDSKFTRIKDGDVYFSNMNYVCAAGTGSFIEEQAKRLGVSLAEFSDMALADRAPYTSDRCTVYMERDIGAMLGEGWPREALAAAVLHSVRDNYISKVVGKSALGDCIVFQGATARNRALVSAFEQLLEKPIHVSSYCHLTGALGAALLCRERGMSRSSFLWETGPIRVEAEECRLCANACSLTVVVRGQVRTAWGMKCGREYADRKPGRRRDVEENATEMERRLCAGVSALYADPGTGSVEASPRRSVTIGIPRCLYNLSYEPLWHAFLSRLGFTVRASRQHRGAMEVGTAVVNSDFCAPMIVSHGYVKQLLDDGVDYIFYPAVTNEREGSSPIHTTFRRKEGDSAFCYYSQYLPAVVGKLTAFSAEERLISPMIPFREKSLEEIAGIIHAELARRFPDVGREEIRDAFQAAYELFTSARKNLSGGFARESGDGKNGERLRVVLLGRPYVAFDSVLNLSLPRTFEDLGAEVYWQEELDLDSYPLGYGARYLQRMHWNYGRQIVRVAEYAGRTSNLYTVFLTCFRCSPDSFLMSYVKDILSHFGKPFLFLQLDAHASDVGYTTRIEAALQTFANHRRKEAGEGARRARKKKRAAASASAPADNIVQNGPRNDTLSEGDTVLIASVDRLISRFWADSFIRSGYRAELLEASASALNTGYRFASGGECMPLVSIVGAAVEKLMAKGFDRKKAFFFMPTIPMACNMPQFPIFADMAFRSAGLEGTKIGLINFMALGDSMPQTLSVKILESYIVACILYKLAFRIRPYEVERGATDEAMRGAARMVSEALRSGTELRAALAEAAGLFRSVARDESGGRKPRIALLGDLYVKYNAVVSEGVQSLLESLDGELVVSSMSEYPAHFFDVGIKQYGEDPRSYRILRTIEGRYEKIVEDVIGDQLEPDFTECAALMEEYGIRHYIAGETSINVGRALWYLKKRSVEAIVHVNPMFCCPGVVTASLFRKMQEDFGIPIIDIFYDGTGNPNRILIPHLHYLKRAHPIAEGKV